MKVIIQIILIFVSSIAFSQVGIGTQYPDNSALLHLDVTSLPSNGKKGFLPPKVALKNNTDIQTIPSPAIGLMVYNLGTAGLEIEGYLYWTGSEWKRFDNVNTTSALLSAIDCVEARLEPNYFIANQQYQGVLKVPYTGGNGGSYGSHPAMQSTGVTGLTATLETGSLNYGDGELIYIVSGTPSVSSPSVVNFEIPAMFGLSSSCNVSVGSGDNLVVGSAITQSYVVPVAETTSLTFDLSTYVFTNGLSSLPLFDGLEINIRGVDDDNYRPIIYNRSSNTKIISYQTFSAGFNTTKTQINHSLTSNSFVGADLDDQVFWRQSNADVVTTNVQIAYSSSIYRWYEFKW